MAHWIEDAILYSIDVPAFRDSNGDGIGDIPGVTAALDYLADLGVTAIWILPFYKSPRRDNGYDVTDHFDVDPRLGTLDDIRELVREASRRNLRIILDLIINHTSDQHPWFQAVLADGNSPYRDHFVWLDDPRSVPDREPVFPGFEDSVWSYCTSTSSYYLHHFHHFEPDLNHKHPAVRAEMKRIIEFWLDIGVDGFRLDAAPFLGDMPEVTSLDPHDLLQLIRRWMEDAKSDAVLVAEADLPPAELPAYFGPTANEVQGLFDFYLNRHFFLALAEESAAPFRKALAAAPEPPPGSALLCFLRNADELSLSWLEDEEKALVLERFAPDPAMRIFRRGIRRRLAPLLGNNVETLKFLFSLQFSLPASPVITYGDEIGLGENLTLPERHSSRTPMRWDSPNGRLDPSPSRLLLPMITDRTAQLIPVEAPAPLPAASEFRDWVRGLLALRRRLMPLRHDRFAVLEHDNPGVLIHCCALEKNALLCLHNFSTRPATIDLASITREGQAVMRSDGLPCGSGHVSTVTLGAHGYLWLLAPSTVFRRFAGVLEGEIHGVDRLPRVS